MSSEVQPQKYIWFDGSLVKWEDAKIHVISPTIHYGTGVFEGIRAYDTERGTAIFRLRDHLKRFFLSAKIYRIEIKHSMETLEEACKIVLRENKLKEAYIRPIALKTCQVMGLDPRPCPGVIVIAAWPWGTYLGKAETGARCKVSSWRRIPPFSLPIAAKACGQYLNSQLARWEALDAGYDEAIMLDYRGLVSEGPGENVFIVRDDAFYTPPEHASVLKGITRDTIIKILRDRGYEVYERDLSIYDLYTADEAFFTGTAAEITPIIEVDGIKIGDGTPGRLTRMVQRLYSDTVRGRIKEYLNWLSFV